MSSIIYYFFIAVGLSMDAFSLAIIYGMNNFAKKKAIILSIIVGIYHFVMPNLSGLLGNIFLLSLTKYSNIILGIVFLVLAIEMLFSLNDEDSKYKLDSLWEMLLFGLAVSIDSFTVGLALSLEKINLIIPGIIFTIVSGVFTMLGLLLGKFLSERVGKIAKVVGIIILFVLSFRSIFK